MENINLEISRISHNGKFRYTVLPINRLQEALQLLIEGFYPYEPVSIMTDVAKNIKAVAELNHLCEDCSKDNISIIAIEQASNKLVGVSFNKIQKKAVNNENSYFEKLKKKFSEKESIALMDVMIECDNVIDLFEYYKVDSLLEIMFLCVSSDYCKQGIGYELINTDLQLLDKLAEKNHVKVATSLFTSPFSQKIGNLCKFDILAIRNYDSFTFNGIKYSDKLKSWCKGIEICARRCKNF